MTGNGTTALSERLRVVLAFPDFPLVSAGLRATIEAELDMVVVGETTTEAELANREIARALHVSEQTVHN